MARSLRAMELSSVNEELVAALVDNHARTTASKRTAGAGAVLVFLPGVAEIESVAERLERLSGLHVLHLHSQLSVAEQRAAFAHPPKGLCKVELALALTATLTITLTHRYSPHTAPLVAQRSARPYSRLLPAQPSARPLPGARQMALRWWQLVAAGGSWWQLVAAGGSWWQLALRWCSCSSRLFPAAHPCCSPLGRCLRRTSPRPLFLSAPLCSSHLLASQVVLASDIAETCR